jgi:tetratricopeptide (TPR) repeat protein
LEESTKNAFAKKVRLIYEYNRNSPLFVKIADSEIEENNIEAAVDILQSGLKTYPDHPVAHMLLGKAYALMGNYNKATEIFKRGSKLIQSDGTYEYYAKEIKSIKENRSLFETTRKDIFFNPEEIKHTKNDTPDLFVQESNSRSENGLALSIDDKLAQLAEEISKAKLSTASSAGNTNQDSDNIFNKDNMIISETLAKIYMAQNEYDEAIKVYEKLIKKKPGDYDHYSNKIKEIRAKLNS